MTLLHFDLGSLCDAQVSELFFYKIQKFSKKGTKSTQKASY